MIKKTVAQLPLPAVLPLLKEVSPVFVNHPKKKDFFFLIKMSLDQSFHVLGFFSSQEGFKDTLSRKWSSSCLLRDAIFPRVPSKGLQVWTTDSRVVSHRAVVMTRWLKAVLVLHTSYLASVSLCICSLFQFTLRKSSTRWFVCSPE